MGMMGFYSNLLTKNKSLGSGFRGEVDQDDKMLQMYHERKNEFSKLIDQKINEIEEEKDKKTMKKFKDEKEDVVREIKQQAEIESGKDITENIENSKIMIDSISKIDEIKKRYLERKRDRTDEKQ